MLVIVAPVSAPADAPPQVVTSLAFCATELTSREKLLLSTHSTRHSIVKALGKATVTIAVPFLKALSVIQTSLTVPLRDCIIVAVPLPPVPPELIVVPALIIASVPGLAASPNVNTPVFMSNTAVPTSVPGLAVMIEVGEGFPIFTSEDATFGGHPPCGKVHMS